MPRWLIHVVINAALIGLACYLRHEELREREDVTTFQSALEQQGAALDRMKAAAVGCVEALDTCSAELAHAARALRVASAPLPVTIEQGRALCDGPVAPPRSGRVLVRPGATVVVVPRRGDCK